MSIQYIVIMLTNIVMGVIGFFLGLRIILRLVSANPATPFVSWIYQTSDALIAPFSGIFPSAAITSTSIFDIPAFIALIVYMVVGYFIIAIVNALFTTTHTVEHHHEETHVHSS